MHYKFYEVKKGKRRDRMNIFACADKFVEDALQLAGVIQDDNPDWIENTTHEFYWVDSNPYIEIEVEERGTYEPKRADSKVFKNPSTRHNTGASI